MRNMTLTIVKISACIGIPSPRKASKRWPDYQTFMFVFYGYALRHAAELSPSLPFESSTATDSKERGQTWGSLGDLALGTGFHPHGFFVRLVFGFGVSLGGGERDRRAAAAHTHNIIVMIQARTVQETRLPA
jgi:hypothetical protein